MTARITITKGTRLIRAGYPIVVEGVHVDGFDIRSVSGEITRVPRDQLGYVFELAPGSGTLGADVHPDRDWIRKWFSVDDKNRAIALRKQEDVLEVETGYRFGHARLALQGEPRLEYDPASTTHHERVVAKAEEVSRRALYDRAKEIAVRNGGKDTTDDPAKIYRWIKKYKEGGLPALIPGQALAKAQGSGSGFPEFTAVLREVMTEHAGRRSIRPNQSYVDEARTRTIARFPDAASPSNAVAMEVAARLRDKIGKTQKQIHTNANRTLGHASAVVLTPGANIGLDSTPGDVIVAGPISGRPLRLAVMISICVATRVIPEVSVVPKDPRSLEVGLHIFRGASARLIDVSNPAAAICRYLPAPSKITVLSDPLYVERGDVTPDLSRPFLAPSLYPGTARLDGATPNTADLTIEVFRRMEISIEVSRPGNSQDNSIAESGIAAFQPFFEQFPTYTTGSVERRGGELHLEELIDATRLQSLARTWAFTVYNLTPSDGLVFPFPGSMHGLDGPESAPTMSPAAMYEVLLNRSGSIQVLSDPFMMYDLLPTVQVQVTANGVEVNGITYDDQWLDDVMDVMTTVPAARARGTDRFAKPTIVLHKDPRDLSRLWLRHPLTGEVRPLPWRGTSKLLGPLSDSVIQAVERETRLRRSNVAHFESRVAEAIADLVSVSRITKKNKRKRDVERVMDAAEVRRLSSRQDHAEIAAHARAPLTDALAPQVNPPRFPQWEVRI